MQTVRFLRGYRGPVTDEQYYEAGAVVELDPMVAAYLVSVEAAELVEPEPNTLNTPENTGATGTTGQTTNDQRPTPNGKRK